MTTTTCTHESTAPSATTITVLLAFELGERRWKLGFTTGLGSVRGCDRCRPEPSIKYSRRLRVRSGA